MRRQRKTTQTGTPFLELRRFRELPLLGLKNTWNRVESCDGGVIHGVWCRSENSRTG